MSDDFSNNPYAATTTVETQAQPSGRPIGSYGGIGRAAYFGYTFLAGIVYNVAVIAVAGAGGDAAILLIPVFLIYIAAIFYFVAQRMINCGYSPWWCVAMIVPLLNFLVGIRAIAFPEGYADHRTLDTPGKIICGLIVGVFLLGLAVVVFAAFSGPR